MVAGRLAEKYHRPTILIALDELGFRTDVGGSHGRRYEFALTALDAGRAYAVTATANDPQQPNVLLMIGDDLGVGTIEAYGIGTAPPPAWSAAPSAPNSARGPRRARSS